MAKGRRGPRPEKAEKAPKRGIRLGDTALALARHPEDAVPLSPGFGLTVNGLVVDGAPTLQQADAAGSVLIVAERASQFAIGDFVNYVEDKFGERSAQIIDEDGGWSLKTVQVYSWLSKHVAPDVRRMDRLGIRHHLLVATLSPGKQREWLNRAADALDGPWTVARLAKALRENGDAEETAWWVLVATAGADEQAALIERLSAEGKTAKAVTRRGRRTT